MIGYYPGCTLKSKAKNLEDSALACLQALEVKVAELPRWNCCGAVFSLADDDLIHHLAPVRDLIRAKDLGYDRLMTLCSMCYNTLARANLLMKEDDEKRKTINLFMDEENDYFGDVKVIHFLQLLKEEVGWDKLKTAVKVPLKGLKVASYYGCTLIRPKEVAIEEPSHLQLLDEMLFAIGAEVVPFEDATACCSSYQILANESAALEASAKILRTATRQGVEALAMSCPVCEYNLGKRQKDIRKKDTHIGSIPTFYFTQLLAISLGVPSAQLGLPLNEPIAAELLKNKNYITQAAL